MFGYSSTSGRRQLIHQLTNNIRILRTLPICTPNKIMKKWESTLYVMLSLPIWAFIYCLAVAYTSDHYKTATVTHCPVPNFAMSVSEATSVPESSKNIWLASILISIYSRIFHANVIFKAFMDNLKTNTKLRSLTNWIGFDW